MPRYREHPLIIPFSMLCPGISQNTKLHHLTLYKGQVWGEKSYLELCNHNVVNIVYSWSTNFESSKNPIEKNGTLYVPPVPGEGFSEDRSQIPYDSEILLSFAELTNITTMTFHSYDWYEDSLEDVTYQIQVGNWMCEGGMWMCVPPHSYFPWYIWTKEGLKYKKYKLFRIKKCHFH